MSARAKKPGADESPPDEAPPSAPATSGAGESEASGTPKKDGGKGKEEAKGGKEKEGGKEEAKGAKESSRERDPGMAAELEELEFFHGKILDEDLTKLLTQNGDYVLRTKGTKIVLSVLYKGAVHDKQLRRLPQGAYSLDMKVKAPTIKELFRKHNQLNVPISFDNNISCLILNPIARQSWELKRDHLELIKKLGEGAFGEVHAGKLKIRMGKQLNVAVKIIKRSANNEKATTELQKEGALMRKFKHDNVVRTFGMVIEVDSIMVVMELISGGGLNDYVKKNRVTYEEKGAYAYDIANGLAYVHSLNCIHRDVACRNCLLDITRKIAKVSDFGLTRQTELYKIERNERIPIRWMAPEVLRTYEYTRSADVYAYAILVWELFMDGQTPYDKQTNAQIKEGVTTSDTFRPQFAAGTPKDIEETVKKCWSTDQAQRPSLADVKVALNKYRSNRPDCSPGLTGGSAPSSAEGAPAMMGGKPKKALDVSRKRSKNVMERSKKSKAKKK